MVDDLPDALFAICHGSGGRLPEGRHVPRQRLDGLTLRRGEGTGLLLHESVVVLLQLPLCGEFLLPPLGQLSSDQPVLVFHQPIVARRPLGLLGGPLQALLQRRSGSRRSRSRWAAASKETVRAAGSSALRTH
jgi:hypothetical protein